MTSEGRLCCRAVHEAAHAVVAVRLGLYIGDVYLTDKGGKVEDVGKGTYPDRDEYAEAMAAALAAGAVADERLCCGSAVQVPWRSHVDFAHIRDVYRSLENLGDNLTADGEEGYIRRGTSRAESMILDDVVTSCAVWTFASHLVAVRRLKGPDATYLVRRQFDQIAGDGPILRSAPLRR